MLLEPPEEGIILLIRLEGIEDVGSLVHKPVDSVRLCSMEALVGGVVHD